jgi:tetratricopeptide (TPR) repeat protein
MKKLIPSKVLALLVLTTSLSCTKKENVNTKNECIVYQEKLRSGEQVVIPSSIQNLYNLIRQYASTDYNKTSQYIDQLTHQSQQLDFTHGLAKAHYTKGWLAFEHKRDYTVALKNYQIALNLYESIGKDGGSGYTLGKLDGTFYGMLRLAPQAINVSLFRPYIWEIKNFLMLLSSLESTFFLILTIIVLVRLRLVRLFYFLRKDTWLLFCLLFTLTFAFGVGVSSFNFGTLSRYKLPLMPFFAIFLFILLERTKKIKNSDSNPQTSLEN